MPSTSSDLIHGIRQHDPSAWSRMVRIYSPLIYHWCRYGAGLPAEDAADILQEVFIAVARKIGDFEKADGKGSYRGWLRVITSNKIRDHLRRDSQQPKAAGGSDTAQKFGQVPDSFPAIGELESLSSSDAGCEQSILINRLLEELRPQFKESSWQAFWQSEIVGRPRQEVANELEMSMAAVNMAIFRIRDRLREELGDLLE